MSWNSIVSWTTSLDPTVSAIRSSRSSGTPTTATFGSMVVNAYDAVSAPALVRALKRVDLPAFGRPTMPIFTRAGAAETGAPLPRARSLASTARSNSRSSAGGLPSPGRSEPMPAPSADPGEHVGRVVHAEVGAPDADRRCERE